MASIRQAAQDVIAEAREEIAWIAVWKDGKGWMSMTFWPDVLDDHRNIKFDEYDAEQLRNIVKLDPMAIIVNGYYDNLGSAETMTRDSLADALRWHYERQTATIAGYLEGGAA